MPEFRFSETVSFEDNVEAFLTKMDGIDAEMAAILRANRDKLVSIVFRGQRNAQSRTDFNKSVMAALDEMRTSVSEEEQS